MELTTAQSFTALGASFHHVDFLVGAPQFEGRIDGLLGQNFLNVTDVEYDFANGVIRLFKPSGCGGLPLAYWSQGKPFSTMEIQPTAQGSRRIMGSASVNGAHIRVLFDTGSPFSMLTSRAAALAGVRRDSPEARAAGVTEGVGPRSLETWIAPFDSFKIGDEEIKNTRLRLAGIELDNIDMLIGADFFLSHRIFVANSQNKLYFTYNGGPVFRLDRGPSRPADGEQASAASPAGTTDEPKDASGFARRAAASAARRDFEHAIADFGRAAELEPTEPKHLFNRGLARLSNGQPVLAMGDFDQALKLKPDYADALLVRGRLRLFAKDPKGAEADFDAALKLDPTYGAYVGSLYVEADQFDRAVAMYDAWIAGHPRSPGLAQALNGRCWARALSGRDLDKALADCDQALKIGQKIASVLDSRGLVHLRLGQLEAAIADYDAALKLQPKLAWSLYGRGVAQLKMGSKDAGAADIKAATELAPQLPERAKRLGVTA